MMYPVRTWRAQTSTFEHQQIPSIVIRNRIRGTWKWSSFEWECYESDNQETPIQVESSQCTLLRSLSLQSFAYLIATWFCENYVWSCVGPGDPSLLQTTFCPWYFVQFELKATPGPFKEILCLKMLTRMPIWVQESEARDLPWGTVNTFNKKWSGNYLCKRLYLQCFSQTIMLGCQNRWQVV